MRYIFILNSFSLKDGCNKLREEIEKISEEKKLDYKIEVNSAKESTEDILNRYKNTKDIILAVGGDGTINRVLNKVVGTKNILGYIPYGTGNDFYRCNKELLKDGINKVDLVKINDKYFINIACFGIDADIGNNNDIVHSKLIPESQRYNMSMLYNFVKYKPRKLQIKIDNKTVEDDYTTVVVCNGRYYGGGYKIGFNSKIDDGLLDVYLVPRINKVRTAKLILDMNKGAHEKASYVQKYSTNKLVIKSDKEVESNVDGEIIKAKEFKIEVIKKGIDIYYDEDLINKLGKIKNKVKNKK